MGVYLSRLALQIGFINIRHIHSKMTDLDQKPSTPEEVDVVNNNATPNNDSDSASDTESETEPDNGPAQIGTYVTTEDGTQLLMSQNNVTVHKSSDGIIHAGSNPAIANCTGHNYSCPIEFHNSQGILCRDHLQPLEEFTSAIELALGYRLTQPTVFGYALCSLCPNTKLRSPKEVEDHVRSHGSILGPGNSSLEQVCKELKKMEILPQTIRCTECFAQYYRPLEAIVHRGLKHGTKFQQPQLCEHCLLPVGKDSFDVHHSKHHKYVCCGKLLLTAGDQIKHSLLHHPNVLSKHLNPITYKEMRTATISQGSSLPWGSTCWLLTNRRVQAAWKSRSNSMPVPGTDEFRSNFDNDPQISPVDQILTPVTKDWVVHMATVSGPSQEFLENYEKLLIIELGKGMIFYARPESGEIQHPLHTEVHSGEMGWCEICHDKVPHDNPDDCWPIAKNASRAADYVTGKYDKNTLENSEAVLIGCTKKYYGYTPDKDMNILNLSCQQANPSYFNGFQSGGKVIMDLNKEPLLVEPNNDYIGHIKRMVGLLPRDYAKPVIIEFTLNPNTPEQSSRYERDVEAFFEQIHQLRMETNFLFVILAPPVNNRGAASYRMVPEQYETRQSNAALLESILMTYSCQFQLPLVITRGIINSFKFSQKGTTLWSHFPGQNKEPIYSHYGKPLREFRKRTRLVLELIVQAHKRAHKQCIPLNKRNSMKVMPRVNLEKLKYIVKATVRSNQENDQNQANIRQDRPNSLNLKRQAPDDADTEVKDIKKEKMTHQSEYVEEEPYGAIVFPSRAEQPRDVQEPPPPGEEDHAASDTGDNTNRLVVPFSNKSIIT